MTLEEQIERDIEQNNFKKYESSEGIHWIPASKPPQEGWVEIIEDEEPEVDPNYVVPWVNRRQNAYPQITEQLNVLYDDIIAGKFGENAKSSSWIQMIKEVKDAIPKDGT